MHQQTLDKLRLLVEAELPILQVAALMDMTVAEVRTFWAAHLNINTWALILSSNEAQGFRLPRAEEVPEYYRNTR